MDVSKVSFYIFNEKGKKVAKWGTPKKKYLIKTISLSFKQLKICEKKNIYFTVEAA
jgi:hypothetical protein